VIHDLPPIAPHGRSSRAARAWAVGLLALALALAACGDKAEPPKSDAPPTISGAVIAFAGDRDPAMLRIAPLASEADHPLRLPGRLAWDEDHTVRVWAPYAGRVERLRVGVGDAVRRGQALAELSSADIGAAQADLHKAEADEALFLRSAARARELADAGVIARKDLEAAEADLARNAAELARARARLAQYGVASQAVTQGFVLSSPLDGVVVERNANPGTEVRSDVQGPPLFTLSDPRTLWVALDLDETQLAQLRPGEAIMLSTAAWPGERFEARVLTVGEGVDPASRTVKLRARVANPQRKLKAEMFVSGEIARRDGLPMVAADAVFLRGTRQCVFVRVAPGRYERREVELRAAGPQYWSVVKGLAADDQVVVGGAIYLNQLLDAAK